MSEELNYVYSEYVGQAFAGMLADASLPSFWAGVLQTIGIDILLAGDNALVIAMACRRLPPQARMWGMILGAGVAVLMRIGFTAVIAFLLTVPGLKIAGGLALFYITVKLLAAEEEADGEGVEACERLWRAVRIIALADLVMSLDNVIAIAAASKGHALTFAIGLMASVPLVVAGAGFVMTLLGRYPVLIWAGGGLLGWVAGQVIGADPAFNRWFSSHYHQHLEFGCAAVGALAMLAAGHFLRRRETSPA
jgi:YjbE family integral membrane protein